MTTSTALQNLREERHTMIGGSDLHHVFSLPPYGCARQLVMSKRPDQYTPDHTFHGNKATERGTQLEDMAAQLFMEQTGLTIRNVAGGLQGRARRNKEFSYIGVHADREIVGVTEPLLDHEGKAVNPEGGPGILSVKVPGEMMFKKIKRDGLPSSYVMQLQYELYCWNRTWGTYALLWADGWELRYFHLRRDDELIKQILDGVHRVWGLVENGPLPDKLDPDSAQCAKCQFRTQCQGEALIAAYESQKEMKSGEEIPFRADPELVRLVEQRTEFKEMLDSAEDLVETVNKKIKEMLGDSPALLIEGYKLRNGLQAGRKTVQREPLEKHLKALALTAESFLAEIPVEAGNQASEQLFTYLTMLTELPEVFAAKYVNTGAPFTALKVYPR